jgi:hypothetical protein
VQTQDRNINQLQLNIGNVIDPLLQNAFNLGALLPNVSLTTGTNQISHGLGRAVQGWTVVRFQNSFAQIYDMQNSNPNPSLLVLVSSAPVTVNLYVF